MATITRTYAPATGDTILAAHLNTDLDTIYSEFNGNIENANIKAAAAIAISKTALGTYTAPTTYTPVISGGTLAGAGTYTTQLGYYTQIGKLVNFLAIVAITNHTGTGDYKLSLPVAVGTDKLLVANVAPSSLTIGGAGYYVFGLATSTETYMLLKVSANNAAATTLQIESDTAHTIYVTGSYLVD